MLLVTWNVNGYNDGKHQILTEYLNKFNPDIIVLTETKKSNNDMTSFLNTLTNYTPVIYEHIPSRYHGISMIINKKWQIKQIIPGPFIIPRYDTKGPSGTIGRLIPIEFTNGLVVVGVYSPNSGTRGLKNLDYRINTWDVELFKYLNELKKTRPVILIGDINVAPNNIDVSDPVKMKKYAGFSPEERNSFNSFIQSGWIDVFRYLHPTNEIGIQNFSWIGNSFRPNYGMRLDNIIITDNIKSLIDGAYIDTSIIESDHLMTCVTLKI